LGYESTAVKLDDGMFQSIVDAVARQLANELRDQMPVTSNHCGGDAGHACTADPRPVHSVDAPIIETMLPKLVALTSSQMAVGRAGNRFRTDLYLRTREGHADARDAVHSDVPEGWAEKNGLVSLRTRCRDRHEYLLFPNQGRRLDDASVHEVLSRKSAPPDVQMIVGDGLSPNAITQNAAATLTALQRSIGAAGWRMATTYYVQHARIGVADEIGVLTGARSTVMLVGERPGLGTGDSLSLYLAVNPRLDQDNSEKNCISNVRPIGIKPDEAAALTVKILQRSFENGVGGVRLGMGWGRQ
jgi:ethanolamine ammonia-lyase small subunit